MALQHYQDALREDLSSDVRNLIERQYQGVMANHELVRGLRDRARTPSLREVTLPCPRRRRGGLHFGPADGENGNGIFNLRDRQGVVGNLVAMGCAPQDGLGRPFNEGTGIWRDYTRASAMPAPAVTTDERSG